MRESMESELRKNAPEKHGDRRRAEKALLDKAERDKKLDQQTKKAEADRKAMLGGWDRVRESVAPQVNVLFSRLERLLRPTVPESEAGHPSGFRVNPYAVMQAQADRRLVNKIWERKTMPIEKDFAFSLVVDVSGSMEGEKQKRAAECAVLMSEVLTRLKVPFEIALFNYYVRVIKGYEEQTSKEKKNQIAQDLLSDGGGTNDHLAVRERAEAMGKRSEEHKFLIVVTDGGSSDGDKLTEELGKALKSQIRVIGLGIGPGTSDVDRYYPIGRGGLSIDPKDKGNAFGPYFAKILEQILTNPEQFVRQALRKKGGADGSNNGE